VGAANPVALATTGLTTGLGARAFTVGSAGVVYQPNPVVAQLVQSVQVSDVPGRRMDPDVLEGVSPRAPQNIGGFVKLFATTDGNEGIEYYAGSAGPFDALQAAWDAKGLQTAKSRMIHGFWVYSSAMALAADTKLALGRFEDANPGRGEGTILNTLARATHEAWLAGEKEQAHYVPYNQGVHDLITWMIENGHLSTTMAVHTNPRKKFKFDVETALIPMGLTPELSTRFERATGKTFFGSKWKVNTVAGEWADLMGIEVPSNPEWATLRSGFLFGLQADNVASVLYGLEDEKILGSLGEGAVADRLQSLVEMLRVVNAAWRINNPWGGLNSPLIATPFALEEDDGIGIDDILKDAVTMQSTLREIEAARVAGTVNLSGAMAAGLEAAFGNGLSEVLDVMVDEAALAEAVRINTGMYNPGGE